MTTTFPAQLPAIRDRAACAAWLKTVPVGDSGVACEAFIAMLGQLEDIPPRPLAYLEILEFLREPVRAAQAEQANLFVDVPQPLAREELAAYDRVSDLGAALSRAYRSLLRETLDGEAPELARRVGWLCQRSIDAIVEVMTAAWLAHRQIDPETWRRLHEVLRLAQSKSVADERVPLAGTGSPSASATELYVRALLLHLAGPYGLSAREFSWLQRWTATWAGKVKLEAALADANQGYAVDLDGEAPPFWSRGDGAAPATRCLGGRPLYRSVVNRLKKLRNGETPAALGLGEDVPTAAAAPLLQGAYRAWFENPAPRVALRRTSAGVTELSSGFAAVQARFAQPGVPLRGAEAWDTVGESASVFRLRRHGGDSRMHLRQLVGLKPPGARSMILCAIECLMAGPDDALELGARAFPGIARPATVRRHEGTHWGAEQPAFVLPELAGEPASLILQGRNAPAGETVQLAVDGDLHEVRLGAIVQPGHDFTRVRFEVSGP